jgi:hypothetical protein
MLYANARYEKIAFTLVPANKSRSVRDRVFGWYVSRLKQVLNERSSCPKLLPNDGERLNKYYNLIRNNDLSFEIEE